MVFIQGFPMHESHNSVWVTGPSIQNYPKNLNYGVLGYQRYNVPNNIPNPDSLGGRFFSKKRKSRKRKSRKSRKSKKRKSRKFGSDYVYQLTPGGVTTEESWGFDPHWPKFGSKKRKSKKPKRKSKRKSKKRMKKSKRKSKNYKR